MNKTRTFVGRVHPLGLAAALLSTACRPTTESTVVTTAADQAGDPGNDGVSSTQNFSVFIKDRIAGAASRVQHAERELVFEYSYEDRGRGPQLRSTWQLDDRGRRIAMRTQGHDAYAQPIDERLEREQGVYAWQNRGEQGNAPAGAAAFYLSMDPVPHELAHLARRLQAAPEQRLPLLPLGEARFEQIGGTTVNGAPGHRALTHVAIHGIDFEPVTLWLDEHRQLFAQVTSWRSVIASGYEGQLDQLREAEAKAQDRRSLRLAEEMHSDAGRSWAITNVAIFDSETASIHPRQTVIVREGIITGVGPSDRLAAPNDVPKLDGHGLTLLPGLWDMHVHLHGPDPLLHLINGVTHVRDMANRADELARYRRARAAGHRIGPKVWPAGIIEGPGPHAAPTKVLAATPEAAIAAVDDYAERGYGQVKIYSSLDPKLVPTIVARARARGMRVSGHVPGGMRARDAIAQGFNEIQHMNFVALNCIAGDYDTRTPDRFKIVAERMAELDRACMDQLAAQMLAHNITIDPTLTLFESMFTDVPGQTSAAYASIAELLPVRPARALRKGGLALPVAPAERDAALVRRRQAFQSMAKLVVELDRLGVGIVAGSDALAGFTLHRELYNYVQAGMSPGRALQIATRDAAKLVGLADKLGAIEQGKLADLVLVAGDPLDSISALSDVQATMVDGQIYDVPLIRRRLGLGG